MSDNTQDNTREVEKLSEVMRDGSRTIEELIRTVNEWNKSHPSTPMGIPTPVSEHTPFHQRSPSAQTSGNIGRESWQNRIDSESWGRRYEQMEKMRNNPPSQYNTPLPNQFVGPPVPRSPYNTPPPNQPYGPPAPQGNAVPAPTATVSGLQRALDELTKRQGALRGLYEQGATPQSLAARNARQQVTEQEGYVANSFAGASSGQRQLAMPAMQAMEKERERLTREELEKRKGMNKELTSGQYAVAGFARSLAGGNVLGAAGSLFGGMGGAGGAIGAVITTALGTILHSQEKYNAEVQRGGAIASPSKESTQKRSEELAQLEEAVRQGELARKDAKARFNQRLAQARREIPGWNLSQDPTTLASETQAILGAPVNEGGRRAERGFRAGQTAALQGKSGPERVQAMFSTMADDLEAALKKAGVKIGEPLKDVVNPAQAGYSTFLQYSRELQIGGLQRMGVQNQLDIRQQQLLRDQNLLLENIDDNSSNLPNLNLWG